MEVDDEIIELDIKINRLKIEYEQYFMRILKREPQVLRSQVDKLITRIANTYISNTAMKFKYRSTVDKYNAFKHYWTRTLKEIEDGTYRRRAESGGIKAPVETTKAPEQTETSKKADKAREDIAAAAGEMLADIAPPPPAPDGNEPELKRLYAAYIQAKKKCNEPTKGITFDILTNALEAQKKKAAKKYGTEDLDFKVNTKGGHARIVVIPKRG